MGSLYLRRTRERARVNVHLPLSLIGANIEQMEELDFALSECLGHNQCWSCGLSAGATDTVSSITVSRSAHSHRLEAH